MPICRVLRGDRFRILKIDGRPILLGKGAFGTVYLGQDNYSRKLVSIKVFKAEKANLPDILWECGTQTAIHRDASTVHFRWVPEVPGLLRFSENERNEERFKYAVVSEFVSLHEDVPVTMSLADALAHEMVSHFRLFTILNPIYINAYKS